LSGWFDFSLDIYRENTTMKTTWMLTILMLSISGAAFAGDKSAAELAVKKITDPAEFKALTVSLQTEMQPGGRYAYVKPDEHRRIDADFQKIQALLEKQAAGVELSQVELAQQYTAQSEANALFHQRDGDREVCERVEPIGSHVPKMVCQTYAHIQESRKNAQNVLYQASKESNPKLLYKTTKKPDFGAKIGN
jgi:hypothetical protein